MFFCREFEFTSRLEYFFRSIDSTIICRGFRMQFKVSLIRFLIPRNEGVIPKVCDTLIYFRNIFLNHVKYEYWWHSIPFPRHTTPRRKKNRSQIMLRNKIIFSRWRRWKFRLSTRALLPCYIHTHAYVHWKPLCTHSNDRQHFLSSKLTLVASNVSRFHFH